MADLYHIESEQSVIGSLLIDPNCHERIDFLSEADFYREDHRIIWRNILLLLAERKPVDAITVAESLLSAGISEDRIGLAYLGELAHSTPSSANVVRYAEVVRNKRMLRDLLAASNAIAEIAQADNSVPAEQRIDEAETIMFRLAENVTSSDTEPRLIGTVLCSVVEDIQERFERGGQIVGLSTGFSDLDTKTCGLQGGDLIIVAGRPAMGKTTFSLNIAENIAFEQNKTALVFSMEMGEKQLTERSIASVGAIPLQKIKNGQLDDDEFSRLSFAIGKMHQSKLVIDDRGGLSVSQMRSKARRVSRKHGLDLIVIDYIQLASGDTGKNGNREQEVSGISRGLKALAKEFNVPVIALSQLSRKVEERADKRPMISDLRESGAIEQDADIILMMYRDEYYKPDTPDKGIAEIIIGKQRMGETGKVMALFQGEYSRFRNLSHEAIRQIEENRANQREESFNVKPMRRKGMGI